jgi:hypothetical protein
MKTTSDAQVQIQLADPSRQYVFAADPGRLWLAVDPSGQVAVFDEQEMRRQAAFSWQARAMAALLDYDRANCRASVQVVGGEV